jgi:hypothetical protein
MDYWHIQGVDGERIKIVCNSHPLRIWTRRFKIWVMIFCYIMRRRWCCLYRLPQTIWLGMCQCILKFGSWIVQRVSRGVQMHGIQFDYIQIRYLHFGNIKFGWHLFTYIILRHKLTEKGTLCNGCLFSKWGHTLRKSDCYTICLEVGILCYLPACISTFVFIWSLFKE